MKKILKSKRLIFDILVGIIIIFTLYRCTGDYTRVFEMKREQYTLKIIGEKNYDGRAEYITDIFFYEKKENYKKIKEIGCGTLLLAGYDLNKEYFYGKSEYGKENREYGIYKNENEMIGSRYSSNNEFLKKQCTGYFVLNLKTGEYQSGLSENEQNKILSDKGIETNMLTIEKFLKKNGKSIRNYEGLESWMSDFGN